MVTNLCALGLVQSVMLRRRAVVHIGRETVPLTESGTVRLPV